MKFKDLPVGEEFKFTPSAPGYGNFSTGKTFVKTSSKKYQCSGDSAKREMDQQRSLFGKKAKQPEYKVGTGEVEVIPLRKEVAVVTS